MKLKLLIVGLLVAFNCFANDVVPMTDARANQIADAIYKVEGGAKTKHPYGILSVKTKNPRQVCLNTIKNNYIRWQKAGSKGDYLEFLAARYAPIGAANDPNNLNKNWLRNLKKLLGQ